LEIYNHATFGILVVAAVMEIAGCFSFWA
jgi:drug/metabolite transporter superfamily protein YnfA